MCQVSVLVEGTGRGLGTVNTSLTVYIMFTLINGPE